MRVVVLLSAYRFPGGDAMSNRVLQLAQATCLPDLRALVVNDWPWDGTLPPAAPHMPDGVELVTLNGKGRHRAARLALRLGRPFRVVAALRRAGVGARDVAAVCMPIGLMTLTTWAALHLLLRCPIIVDALERHDRSQFRRGWFAPYFIRHRWSSFLSTRLADRVIAVSTVLGRRFAARARPVLVVPPLVDCDAYDEPRSPPIEEKVRLVYAGTASTKDLLNVLVEGILSLPERSRARVELVIAGLDRSGASEHSDLRAAGLDALGDRVTFLGRVPRERVLAALSSSHFAVLVRPTGGYADAGFPSKVPEALAAGCPVLLNHTSDLAQYIQDGREGIVLQGYTADDVRRGLETVLSLDHAVWRQMSRAARQRALEFDYRSWAPAVAAFINPTSTASQVSTAVVSRRPAG